MLPLHDLQVELFGRLNLDGLDGALRFIGPRGGNGGWW